MKNFVMALILLALIVGAILVNGYLTRAAAKDIKQALLEISGGAKDLTPDKIAACSDLVEEKRFVLHLGVRHSYIDALALNLEEAKAYCTEGDVPSMTASLSAAIYRIERIGDMETFAMYNLL